MLIMTAEFNLSGSRKLSSSGAHGDVEMEKPVKEMSASEIIDEDPGSMDGVNGIDTEQSVRQVSELPEEKAPVEEVYPPEKIKRENSAVVVIQQETEVHEKTEGCALDVTIGSSSESLQEFENRQLDVAVSKLVDHIVDEGACDDVTIAEENGNPGSAGEGAPLKHVNEPPNHEAVIENSFIEPVNPERVEGNFLEPELSMNIVDSEPAEEEVVKSVLAIEPVEAVITDTEPSLLEVQAFSEISGRSRQDSSDDDASDGRSVDNAEVTLIEGNAAPTVKKELAATVFEIEGDKRTSSSPAGDESEYPSGSMDMKKSIVDASSNAELQGKSGHDHHLEQKGLTDTRKNISEKQLSPTEIQKNILRPTITPSPPRREGSQVYSIVMALEGLQVGEKCIHGKIDHGLCHARQGDRKTQNSPPIRIQSETSNSLNNNEDAVSSLDQKQNLDVTSTDGKRVVYDHGSFALQDTQSEQTTQQTSTITTVTYTDTVVFRREDGFLPGNTDNKGSLADFESSGASGSTTHRVRIVHDFPADRSDIESEFDASASEKAIVGESEVEKILRLQETHDLVCPVCQSCITKRVILRKRKRTSVTSSVDKWETDVQNEEENVAERSRDSLQDSVEEEYEDYGCLECFIFLFRRERSVQRTEVVIPGTSGASAPDSSTVSSQKLLPEQSDVRSPEAVPVLSPTLLDEDYDNRCLPIFFTWRRRTSGAAISAVVAPLLRQEERDAVVEGSSHKDSLTSSEDIPSGDPPASVSEQLPAPEVEQLGSEIYELPVAPAAGREVKIHVLVMESQEDRLCFPFLWRKATETTQEISEIPQTLLSNEDESTECEDNQVQVEGGTQQYIHRSHSSVNTFDIGDELWMYPENVLMSVAPQDEPTTAVSCLNNLPGNSTEPKISVKAISYREPDHRANRFCLPSWSSSKSNSEETGMVGLFSKTEIVEAESFVETEINTSKTTQSLLSRSKAQENKVSFSEDISELNTLSIVSPLDETCEEIEKEEEFKKGGIWTCCVPGNCLPSYSELASQPKGRPCERFVSESPIEILGVSRFILSKEVKPKVQESVAILERFGTQMITTINSNNPADEYNEETIGSVMVDESTLSRSLEVGVENTAANEWLEDPTRQGYSREEIHSFGAVREVEQDSGQQISVPESAKGAEQPLEASTNQLVLDRDASLDVVETHDQNFLSVQEVDGSCCFPKFRRLWGESTTEDEQLREPLLGRDSEKVRESSRLLDQDSTADFKNSSARVTIQTHMITTIPRAESGVEAERNNLSCTNSPWTGSHGQETTVTVTTDHTVIEVEGTDVTSTLLAATRAAEDAGMVVESLFQPPEYLKSIVYGGLDVSLTSLGVIAAAAGGDAETRNVLALGLAYLFIGFIAFFYKIQDLHSGSRTQFRECIGPRFWVNAPLAMLSFLFFGSLSAIAFGCSFTQSNDHDYKMAVTVVVSTVAVALLGCGKVASKLTTLSYRRTVSTLITAGVVAAVAGFYSGRYISKLL